MVKNGGHVSLACFESELSIGASTKVVANFNSVLAGAAQELDGPRQADPGRPPRAVCCAHATCIYPCPSHICDMDMDMEHGHGHGHKQPMSLAALRYCLQWFPLHIRRSVPGKGGVTWVFGPLPPGGGATLSAWPPPPLGHLVWRLILR